jgi:hypothetical protein
VSDPFREADSAAGAVLASLTAYELLGSARLKSEDQSCLLGVEERLSATVTNTGDTHHAPSSPRRPMQESSLVRVAASQVEGEVQSEGESGSKGEEKAAEEEEEDLWGTAARWDEVSGEGAGGWSASQSALENLPPAPTVTGVVDWGGAQSSESDHDDNDYQGIMSQTMTAGPRLIMNLEPISERASQEGELLEDSGRMMKGVTFAGGAATAAAGVAAKAAPAPKGRSRLGGMVSASLITLQELADISKLSLTDPSSRTGGRGDDGDDEGTGGSTTRRPAAAIAAAAGKQSSSSPPKKKKSSASAKAKGAVAEKIAALELAAAVAASAGASGADIGALKGTRGPSLTAGKGGRVGSKTAAGTAAGGSTLIAFGSGGKRGLGPNAVANKASSSTAASGRQLKEIGAVQGGSGEEVGAPIATAAALSIEEVLEAAATAAAAEAEVPTTGALIAKAAAATLAKKLITGDRLAAAAAALESDSEQQVTQAATEKPPGNANVITSAPGAVRKASKVDKAAAVSAAADAKSGKADMGIKGNASAAGKGGKADKSASTGGKKAEGGLAGGVAGKSGVNGAGKQRKVDKSPVALAQADSAPIETSPAVAGESEVAAIVRGLEGKTPPAGAAAMGKQARAERLVALMAAIENAAASKPSSAKPSEQDTSAEEAVAAGTGAVARGMHAPMNTREVVQALTGAPGAPGDGVTGVTASLQAAAAAVQERLGSDGLSTHLSTLDSTVGALDLALNDGVQMLGMGYAEQPSGGLVSGLNTIARLEAAAEAIEAKLGSSTLTRPLSSTGSTLDLSSGFVHRSGLTIRIPPPRKSEVAAGEAVAPAVAPAVALAGDHGVTVMGDQGVTAAELWSAHFSPVASAPAGPKEVVISSNVAASSDLWSAHFSNSSPLAANAANHELTHGTHPGDQNSHHPSTSATQEALWSEAAFPADLSSTAATVATAASERERQVDQSAWSVDMESALAVAAAGAGAARSPGKAAAGMAGQVPVPGLSGTVSPSRSAEGQRRMVWAQGVKVPQRIRDVVNGDLLVQSK